MIETTTLIAAIILSLIAGSFIGLILASLCTVSKIADLYDELARLHRMMDGHQTT